MKMNEYLLMLIESKGFSIRSFAAHIEVPYTTSRMVQEVYAHIFPKAQNEFAMRLKNTTAALYDTKYDTKIKIAGFPPPENVSRCYTSLRGAGSPAGCIIAYFRA